MYWDCIISRCHLQFSIEWGKERWAYFALHCIISFFSVGYCKFQFFFQYYKARQIATAVAETTNFERKQPSIDWTVFYVEQIHILYLVRVLICVSPFFFIYLYLLLYLSLPSFLSVSASFSIYLYLLFYLKNILPFLQPWLVSFF